MKPNEAVSELCGALDTELGKDDDFDLALGELIGKRRRRHDLAMRDAEAARLLPLGAEVVAERQHCHRATVYRRASRAKTVARHFPSATVSA